MVRLIRTDTSRARRGNGPFALVPSPSLASSAATSPKNPASKLTTFFFNVSFRQILDFKFFVVGQRCAILGKIILT